MSERELDEGLDWIDDRFHLVRCEDREVPASGRVIGSAGQEVELPCIHLQVYSCIAMTCVPVV